MAHPDPVVDSEAVVWDGGALSVAHRHERSLSRPPGSGRRGQSEGGAQAVAGDRLSRRAWGQPRVAAYGRHVRRLRHPATKPSPKTWTESSSN
ncbi:hypothetical protein DIPPA_32507 [Diplonema papillatum]|nr:hypothetical protein DIPPA_32507 [Diplonema papillatum]